VRAPSATRLLRAFGRDVAISTAILNGARFPWVSPGGTFPNARCGKAAGGGDHILDGGNFDNAGNEMLRELVRAIRTLPDGSGASDRLGIVFVLIGYRGPDASRPTSALLTNDIFGPFIGSFTSMPAHGNHLAREMKLFDQTKLDDPDPYVSRIGGGEDVDYAAIVLCAGHIDGRAYVPPMDWILSGKAKRYIENALIPGTGACAAEANVNTIRQVVERLGY
jgi:hypothetical protein